jgi:choline kinase|tara:strand:- start:2552 stop:3277 length:726 start_codon:yes stop_codon:yes gene_type:complete
MDLLILAAGKGNRIFHRIKKNKCLLKINNQTLLNKIIKDAKKTGYFNNIKIVVGFKKKNIINEIKDKKIISIYNKDFNSKEMLHSLRVGLEKCKNDTFITYSDIYYSPKIFQHIQKYKKLKKITLPIQLNWKKIWKVRNKNILQDCETLIHDSKYNLKEIGNKILDLNHVMGQYMGLVYFPKHLIKKINFYIKQNKSKLHISQFLNILIQKKINITCIPTKDYWYEFDDFSDLQNFKKTRK